MKRFGMAVAALLMCATMSFAQKPSLSREPFVVSTEKLANYLQLTPSQLDEVANINEYFIEMQNASVKASAKFNLGVQDYFEKLALNCRTRRCIRRFTVT